MIEKLDTKSKIKFLIIGFIVLHLCSFLFVLVYSNYYENTYEYKSLVKKEIKGRIIDMKDESRGSYYLKIKSLKSTSELHSLPIALDVEEYNIQIGDSVCKEAKSKKIAFYKLKNGIYKKIALIEF
jgi:hypothetical protein